MSYSVEKDSIGFDHEISGAKAVQKDLTMIHFRYATNVAKFTKIIHAD
jgi:hypothetical protein